MPPKLRSACDFCHQSKVKCPGGTTCARCEAIGILCVRSISNHTGRPRGARNKKTLSRNQQPQVETSEIQPTTVAPENLPAATFMHTSQSQEISPRLLGQMQDSTLEGFEFTLYDNDIYTNGCIDSQGDENQEEPRQLSQSAENTLERAEFESSTSAIESWFSDLTSPMVSIRTESDKSQRRNSSASRHLLDTTLRPTYRSSFDMQFSSQTCSCLSKQSRALSRLILDSHKTRELNDHQGTISAARATFDTWGEFFNCYRHMTTADLDIYLVIGASIRLVANIISEPNDAVFQLGSDNPTENAIINSEHPLSDNISSPSSAPLAWGRTPFSQPQWALSIQPRPGSIEQQFVSSSLLFDALSSVATASHRLHTLATQNKMKLQSNSFPLNDENNVVMLKGLEHVMESMRSTTAEIENRMQQLSAKFTGNPWDEQPLSGMDEI